jgi:hypothetical protein
MARSVNLSANQLKVGDKLVRRSDHLRREDETVEIVAKHTNGRVTFEIKRGFRTERITPQQLCADGYSYVIRDGKELDQTFFCKYW